MVEVIDKKIHEGVPSNVNDELIESLNIYTVQLKKAINEYTKTHHKKIEINNHSTPPCVIHLLNDLEKGINLSHMERLILATFYINLGYDESDINTVFSTAPDYNENKTRYGTWRY